MSRTQGKEAPVVEQAEAPAANNAASKFSYINNVYLGSKGDGKGFTPKGQYSNITFNPDRNCVSVRFPIMLDDEVKRVSTDITSLNDIIKSFPKGPDGKANYDSEYSVNHRNIRLGAPDATREIYWYEEGTRYSKEMTNADLSKSFNDCRAKWVEEHKDRAKAAGVEAPSESQPEQPICDVDDGLGM